MAKSKWDWDAFRLAVIEAGIRGDLTTEWRLENPDTEPAHILLDRIAEEKAELVRTKQIKKEKPLPPVSDDDTPFDIPSGWEWHKLGACASYVQRGKSPSYVIKSSIPVISQKCVRWSGLDMSPARFIDEDTLIKYKKVRLLQPNDILWNSTGDGTVGRACLYEFIDHKIAVADSHVTVIRTPFAKFFSYCIASAYVQNNLAVQGSTKQTELNLTTIKGQLLPLPPLEEQKEIVRILDSLNRADTSIDELHPIVARIKSLERNFMALAKEFENQEKRLEQLRASLLQEAISGQMTAEWRLKNPNTEPAHILLDRIAEEKAELVRSKQIKKEKPLPPIFNNNMPSDIPDSWQWSRLGEIVQLVSGRDLTKSEYNDSNSDGVPYITGASNFENGTLIENRWTTRPISIARKGDLLFTCKGTIGAQAFCPFDACHIARQVMSLRCGNFISIQLISSHLAAHTQQLKSMAKSQIPGVSRGDLLGLVIPLPPLEEQKEIVRQLEVKLNAVQGLQDKLNEDLETAQTLLKAKLKEVFEKKDAQPTASLSPSV